jgi:hypothetical protein
MGLKKNQNFRNLFFAAVMNPSFFKGIVQPFELGGETRLIRSAVKY